MDKIKFGTDGWRAVIAREFTMENVRRVAQATALYFKELPTKNKPIIVGYDNRFLSEEFAQAAAGVLCANGLSVLMTGQAMPTPAVSWGVKHFKAAGAVVITSSHNPYEYNGFKIKSDFGGSALPETTQRIETLIDKQRVKSLDLEQARQRRLIKPVDLEAPYLNKITAYVDMEKIRKFPLRIVYDPLYGSGLDFLGRCLEWKRPGANRCKVLSIHNQRDPLFGGLQPEPVEESLRDLKYAVRKNHAHLGIAVDGDADRVGLVDDQGRYITSHKILGLLIRHFIKNRKVSGPVGKTISGTFLIDRMCAVYGLELRETPVGFKHLGELILKENFMLAGEESGGMGFHHYIPERDGVLAGLLLLELAAMEGRPLSWILKEMEKEFGAFHYQRLDLGFPLERRAALLDGLTKNPPALMDRTRIRKIKDFDGVKFILEDDSWLLIRPSGTEPLVRIYAESSQPARVRRLLETGRQLAFKYANK